MGPRGFRLFPRVRLALGLAAVLAAIWLAAPRVFLWHAGRLLAETYTETRPFAVRLPDRGHNAIQSAHRHFASPKLIRALTLLRRLENFLPGNPEVSRLLGRAAMIDGGLDDAVEAYQRALELDPGNSGVRLELSGVFLTRAREQRRPVDLAMALEQAGRAEAFEARSAASAFNLALLYEALPAPHLAAEEWRHCVALETDPEWRREAQSHSSALDAQLHQRARRMGALDSPAAFLAEDAARNYLAETALEPAISRWLPLRFADPAADRALQSIAGRALSVYRDPWLRDLLQLPRSAATTGAYRALAGAAVANAAGSHEQASNLALDARRQFDRLGSPAGALGARLQLAYALHRRNQTAECVSVSEALTRDLQSTGYSWLASQASLELTTCAAKSGDLGSLVSRREKLLADIERTGYQGLALRALGFLIEPDLVRANPIRLWRLSREGLERFWQCEFSAARAQQFYIGGAMAARDSGLNFAAIVLAREGTQIMEEMSNLPWRALTLSFLGSTQLAAGLNTAASRTFAAAEALFRPSDDDAVSRRYRLQASLLRAHAEAATSDPASVVRLLEPLYRRAESDIYGYSQVEAELGLAYLHQRRFGEARECFRNVVARTLQALAKLSDQSQRDVLLASAQQAFRGQIQLQLAIEKDPSGAFALWKQFRATRTAAAHDNTPDTLPAGISALAIVPLPGGTAEFAADHAGVEARWLPDAGSSLENDARRFTSLCGNEQSAPAEIERIARSLYDRLIQPLEHRLLGGRILAISAEGALGAMPWSALRDRRGRLLLEKQATVLGSEFALGWSPWTTDPRRRPLVIAAPALAADLAAEFPPLGDSLEEARLIAAGYPDARVLTGTDATVTALKELLPHSAFFHFGGHGMTNGGYGAILLASEPGQSYGGVLGSPEIAGLDLHGVRVISLASCSSGVGEWMGLVNPDSLVRSLLDAGTRNVIAAPWQVDSTATGELFSDLYGHLRFSPSVAEALRQSCLRIHSRQSTEHPYYWAGFQTYGVPD